MATVHPEVLWAQRSSESDPTRNVIYLTITAPDVPKENYKMDLQTNKLKFTGKSKIKDVTYACDMDLFGDIDVDNSKINHTDKNIEMVLRKKEAKEEFWPRLLKEKAKVHWLKTDFDKWVDEDEQDPNADEDFMANAGGMGGMGGEGGGGGFEGIDFSKFGAGPGGPGGMGGMPGMGGMGMDDMAGGSDDEELDDDDDDEMPALEGEEKASAAKTEAKAHSGIEEIE